MPDREQEQFEISPEHLHRRLTAIEELLQHISKQNKTIMSQISDLTTANALLIQKADIIDGKADILSAGLDKVIALIGSTNISAADQKLIDDAVTATQADAATQDAEAAKLDAEIAKIPA
jgi:hypothetical protein